MSDDQWLKQFPHPRHLSVAAPEDGRTPGASPFLGRRRFTRPYLNRPNTNDSLRITRIVKGLRLRRLCHRPAHLRLVNVQANNTASETLILQSISASFTAYP